ncbi:MAG: hypothetical protein WC500_03335 [Candidatus Margulisiibacteriota bacterium]
MTNNIEDELIRDDLRDNKDLEKEIRTTYLQATSNSVDQLRRWIVETITISSTILGAFIAISANNSQLIKNPSLLKYALLLVLILIVYSVIYIKNSLFNDIKGLISQSDEYLDVLCKQRICKTKYILTKEPSCLEDLRKIESEQLETIKKRNANKKKSNMPYSIVTYLFIAILILLLISMFELDISSGWGAFLLP